MDLVRKIESGGNARAWNRSEDARGLYQIRKIVLVEFNQYCKKNYNMDDLWNPNINTEIAQWYLEVRIPQMLRYYHVEVTVKNIILAYNAGISNARKGRVPEITRKYLEKYQKNEGEL